MKTFIVPGTLIRPGTRRKPQTVSFFIEAEDREDALWQAHHGVIEMEVAATFPRAEARYDLRKLRLQPHAKK